MSSKLNALLEELTALYKIKTKLEEHEMGQEEESEAMPNNQQRPPQLTLSREESALYEELIKKAKLEKLEPA